MSAAGERVNVYDSYPNSEVVRIAKEIIRRVKEDFSPDNLSKIDQEAARQELDRYRYIRRVWLNGLDLYNTLLRNFPEAAKELRALALTGFSELPPLSPDAKFIYDLLNALYQLEQIEPRLVSAVWYPPLKK